MPDFILHSVPGSPYGRAVLILLAERGQTCRLEALRPGTARQEPHISRHPFGRIPVLAHGDFTLYETQAILRYLDRVLPGPCLTPADPRIAARMDQLMNICDWYLMHGVNNVIGFHRIVGPRLFGLAPDEAAIAAAMPAGHAVINELARLLGDQDFLTGPSLTLADIMLAPHLNLLALTPEWTPLSANAPNLTAWLDRMNDRLSLKATTWERVAAMAGPVPA